MEQQQANKPFIDERSYLERRQDEIEESWAAEYAEFVGMVEEGGEEFALYRGVSL